ncbi:MULTISPECIES: bifunctional diguanylate cyclase/phosphodiesterase [unclassified Novosphingobium]|uniref:putative bifunctional diguanylate cyclase/phosphodiesterase n=1 Tax=unclassified Novosphingobium TaxID=2644732 RepID=UPI00135CDCAD|nr:MULTISPECIES: EAL domain-containing protein [unclassified Novosphingobium]
MKFPTPDDPLKEIAEASEVTLREQHAHLRGQIPLMYALMFINAAFLGIVTHGDVSPLYSLAIPSVLCTAIAGRAMVWVSRRSRQLTVQQIRRHLYGTIAASAILSAAFGGWGLLLLHDAEPVRGTSIALYVFVGSISCCYCMQALPVAGWLVLLFGAMPVTVQFLVSGDWYRVAIGLTFILAAAVILRSLANSYAAFRQIVRSQSEMSALVTALQYSEERYRLAALAANDIIWDVSLEEGRINLSSAAIAILGYPDAPSGTSADWWVERIHPDDRARVLLQIEDLEDAGKTSWTEQFRFLAGGGAYLDLIAKGYVVRNGEGRPARLVGSLQDVTAQKHYEDGLRWAALHDSLTKLPNRELFAATVEAALEEAARQQSAVGLVVLDLDLFKSVNDSLGHHGGDALLTEVATRLTRAAPASATVARLGGDEFGIILPDWTAGNDTKKTVADLLVRVGQPMSYEGRQIDVSLSGGVAVAFEDGATSKELFRSADLALYAAKGEGAGRICVYHAELRTAAEREKRMLADARLALQDDRIVPFYQPKVCLRTGACVGFEALLRWHDGRGLQPPAEIGAALADPDLSVLITARMLDRVIADMSDWAARGVPFGRIAINGSAGDFRRRDFAQRILSRMQRAGLRPWLLELEVTESVFLGQVAENVSEALQILSEEGVTIALDDFGTGFASLTHLKQFPVDIIKIDRSFVSKLGMVETQDAAIVGAVIGLARSLGIHTVAEGIETPEQLTHLAASRCDFGQGYMFGRPMAAAQVEKVVADWDAQAILAACGSGDWGGAARTLHSDRFV